jgi:hypothetical protein
VGKGGGRNVPVIRSGRNESTGQSVVSQISSKCHISRPLSDIFGGCRTSSVSSGMRKRKIHVAKVILDQVRGIRQNVVERMTLSHLMGGESGKYIVNTQDEVEEGPVQDDSGVGERGFALRDLITVAPQTFRQKVRLTSLGITA